MIFVCAGLVWTATGVVLYEMLAGRALLSQDTANDALVDVGDSRVH